MKTTLILAVIATSLLMFQITSAAPGGICDLPLEEGDCDGIFPRYFYNKDTGKCERFFYGGCRGNKNNFLSQRSCDDTCKLVEENLPILQ